MPTNTGCCLSFLGSIKHVVSAMFAAVGAPLILTVNIPTASVVVSVMENIETNYLILFGRMTY